jgi:hypothetical protein
MKASLALVPLVLLACGPTDINTSPCYKQIYDALGSVGGATVGALCPAFNAQAVGPTGPTVECTPVTGDDPCVTCAKASCCTESLSCFGDPSCDCIVRCRTDTAGTVESCSAVSQCNASPNATYAAEIACLTKNCAAECPRLQ